MRMLLLCPNVLSSVGGVAQYTLALGEGLRSLGVQTHILTDAGQCVSEKNRDWIHPMIEKWEGNSVADVIQKCEYLKPDWIVMQYVPQLYRKTGLAFQAVSIPAILKKRLRCKTAVTFHEFFSGWGLTPQRIFFALVTRFLTSRLLAGCDKGMTTCPRYQKDLKRTFPCRPICMIPVGSNIQPCSLKADDRESLIRRYDLTGYKVLGVLGAMSIRRNYEIGLDILKLAQARGMKLKMMLIGNMGDPESQVIQNFKARAKELKVTHLLIETGHLSSEEVSYHLQLADVMIFPQVDGISTRSTALMSALEHGGRIVAHRPIEGNFLQSLPRGIELVERHDSANFAEKTIHMLNVSGEQGSSESSLFFEKYFSRKVISQSYLDFLRGGN